MLRIPKPGCRCVIVMIMAVFFLSARADIVRGDGEGCDTVKELDRMFFRAEKAMENKDYVNALRMYDRICDKSVEAGDKDGECLSLYNMGVVYYTLAQDGEALNYFQKAYKMCLENKLKVGREILVLNGIAGIFFKQNDIGKAKKFVERAYRLALDNDIKGQIEMLASDMALICNKEGRYEEAEKFIEISLRNIEGDKEAESRTLTILAETRFNQKRHDDVISLSSKILDNEHTSSSNRAIVYAYLISIYTDRRQFEKGKSYIDLAIENADVSNKSYVFDVISGLYEKSGRHALALQMKDSIIMYQDSLSKTSNLRVVEGAHTQFEMMKYKADTEKRMAVMRQRNLTMGFVVSTGTLVLILIIIIISRQKIKMRLSHQLTKAALENEHKENLLNQERIRETELIARHEREMMKKEIEQKGRELSATAMFVTSRNELIEDIVKRLEIINDKYDIDDIRKLNVSLRQQARSSIDRESLVVNFEAADPDFARRLMSEHPDLLDSDVRFLSYVRMNMQNKDIASLLNIAPDSCKRRKIRLSKKLGLSTSGDLYNYIVGI